MARYKGFYHTKDLPFAQKQEIIIPKGTTVKTMHPQRASYETKRQQTIRIHHFGSGMTVPLDHARRYYPEVVETLTKEQLADRRFQITILNPTVCWPGTGGYWCEVDINDVLEANGVSAEPDAPNVGLEEELPAPSGMAP